MRHAGGERVVPRRCRDDETLAVAIGQHVDAVDRVVVRIHDGGRVAHPPPEHAADVAGRVLVPAELRHRLRDERGRMRDAWVVVHIPAVQARIACESGLGVLPPIPVAHEPRIAGEQERAVVLHHRPPEDLGDEVLDPLGRLRTHLVDGDAVELRPAPRLDRGLVVGTHHEHRAPVRQRHDAAVPPEARLVEAERRTDRAQLRPAVPLRALLREREVNVHRTWHEHRAHEQPQRDKVRLPSLPSAEQPHETLDSEHRPRAPLGCAELLDGRGDRVVQPGQPIRR